MWKVETNQKLLVSAATILLLQNTLILALSIISIFREHLDLVQLLIRNSTYVIDIVGITLLGAGLYGFSKAVPKGGLFAERSGLLFLFWVPLTLIWRLFGRFFSPQISRDLSTEMSMAWVFFLASIILAVAVYNLNKMIGRFREQGIILEGGDALYTTYAVLNVIGVFMLTLGSIGVAPFLEQLAQIDSNDPPSPFEFLQGTLAFRVLLGVGLFIKGVVVPILGLLLFSQLRGVFCETALPSKSNLQ